MEVPDAQLRHRSGFTLIELSIVLVIIALVAGGVLAGKELIEAARIRSQITQFDQISAAVNTFRMKYNALPGDFSSNAPSMGLGEGTYSPFPSWSDNGQIEDSSGHSVDDGVGIHQQAWEPYTFFGQLVDANLIKSHFACAPTPPLLPGYPTLGNYALILNSQASMIAITHLGSTWLYLGINLSSNGCNGDFLGGNVGGVMTPIQAFAIDQKIDDGIPASGNFYPTMLDASSNLHGAVDNKPGQCVVDATSKAYIVSNTQSQCSIMVKLN